MTIGDKSLIDDDWYQQFIDSGLVHLIAVSGGNIAIVVIFCSIVLFWVPFYVRQMLLMVIIVVYAMIVGDDSSVIRAAVMGCMTLLVLLPGRIVSIRRIL
jgi:competence protein ComEC